MTDFRRTIDVAAEPDRVFRFASSASNLPRFVPTTRSAEQSGGGSVHVQGEAHGQPYEDQGRFHVDPDKRLMRWGSDEGGYRGELSVEEAPEGARVAVSLHFPDDADTPPEEEIERDLEESLERLRSAVG